MEMMSRGINCYILLLFILHQSPSHFKTILPGTSIEVSRFLAQEPSQKAPRASRMGQLGDTMCFTVYNHQSSNDGINILNLLVLRIAEWENMGEWDGEIDVIDCYRSFPILC